MMQSAVEDDVLAQVFDTLTVSAARQFTGKRGALFWAALQGIDADQLVSVSEHDGEPAMLNPDQPGAAGGSSSTAATPPPTPHHRPSWMSFDRTR